MPANILIIDDEPNINMYIERFLVQQGYSVFTAGTGNDGLHITNENSVNLAIIDLNLPDINGIEVLSELKKIDRDLPVILMTGQASIETAVVAVKAGAFDYLTKPIDLMHLDLLLTRALEGAEQKKELQILKKQFLNKGSFAGLIGVSVKMQEVYSTIQQIAASSASALILGETGTGKEMVAQAIHSLSPRAKSKLIPVNCGALAENLLESELFGHERGAFTGAIRTRIGLIEQAQNGTLFLDEIDSMSQALQVKLLRAIQEREIVRVGSEKVIPVDFRLITATNADLESKMKAGLFRSDLYYRLGVVTINLPPLRNRRSDIPLLVDHFMTLYSEMHHKRLAELSPEAIMLLKAYEWNGNVRELQNVVEQIVLQTSSEQIKASDLPEKINQAGSIYEPTIMNQLTYKKARDQFERNYFSSLLRQHSFNITSTAKSADISRRHLYNKLQQLDIDLP